METISQKLAELDSGQDRWTEVDEYFSALLDRPDSGLEQVLAASDEAGLPSIAVSTGLGRLLFLLAKLQRAESILEIGTLGGYSTIWLARALPPKGRLVTLERDPKHARVARENLDRGGVAESVEIREGVAADTLRELAREGAGPFDLIFIDADKAGLPDYLSLSLELSRPGTLIVVDNVVRGGAVIDSDDDDPDVRGVRRFLDLVARNPQLVAAPIQTVGSKGYDGVALVYVEG